jgi:hypothetical protein
MRGQCSMGGNVRLANSWHEPSLNQHASRRFPANVAILLRQMASFSGCSLARPSFFSVDIQNLCRQLAGARKP